MDVRDYEYIIAIAEHGNITRAASQLFITQPALTKFLQRTEKTLGMKLFFRSGNQLILTDAGKRYVETGRAIVHLDRQLSEHLNQELTANRSRIRFGFSMGRSYDIMNRILPAFYERYPDIYVSLSEDTSRHQMELLMKNDIDMAMVTNVEHLPEYVYLPVETQWLSVVVPVDSPLLAEAKEMDGYPFPVIAKECLENIPFVALSPKTNSGYLVKELCRKHGIRPRVALELNNVRSIIDAVECGYGISMFMSIPHGEKRIRYLSIEGIEQTEQTASLIYRSDKKLTAYMKYFIELFKQA